MARVLVVDDSKFMRITLKKFIESESGGRHQVVGEAEDSASAFERYKELRPDIVTMDIIMPTETGITAVKNIIAFDSQARIVMVSAMGQDGVLDEAMQLGAKGFIKKPIKGDEIVAVIDKILQG